MLHLLNFFSSYRPPIAAPYARSPRCRLIPATVLSHFSLIDSTDGRLLPRLLPCLLPTLHLSYSIMSRSVYLWETCLWLSAQPWTGRGLPRWCGQVRPTPATACPSPFLSECCVCRSARHPTSPTQRCCLRGQVQVPSSLQQESIVQSWPLHTRVTSCVRQHGLQRAGCPGASRALRAKTVGRPLPLTPTLQQSKPSKRILRNEKTLNTAEEKTIHSIG